jgi:hypothetical protein
MGGAGGEMERCEYEDKEVTTEGGVCLERCER